MFIVSNSHHFHGIVYSGAYFLTKHDDTTSYVMIPPLSQKYCKFLDFFNAVPPGIFSIGVSQTIKVHEATALLALNHFLIVQQ